MSKKLIVNNGRRERELVLVGNLVVGRDPMCDISDADSLLSRRHAEFMVGREEVTVRDLGSRNGVFVNGKKVAEGPLQSGDVVQIGHLRLLYIEDQAPLSAVVVDDTAAPDSTDISWPRALPFDRVSPGPVTAAVAPQNERPPMPAHGAPAGVFEGPSVLDTGDVRPASGAARLASIAPAELAPLAPAAPAAQTTPPSEVARQPRASRVAKGSWSAFVFTRVAMLAAIVCLSSLVPLFVQRGTSVRDSGSIWLALPIVVALLASYGVGALISGRTIQALTTLNQDVELAASGDLEAVSDPLGAKPTQDLANTVNRMIARLRSEATRPRNV